MEPHTDQKGSKLQGRDEKDEDYLDKCNTDKT
jgi:hypothetical protein